MEPLWRPASGADNAMTRFMAKAGARAGRPFADYEALRRWALEDSRAFWRLWLEESGIVASGDRDNVRTSDTLPDARWFPGLTLNFAENLLRFDDTRPALVSLSESRPVRRTTYAELRRKVAAVADALRTAGVGKGDRVAGYVPNSEEAVIAMLATAAIGATWSSCSPDFGTQGILDRFGQIMPKVLFAANGYAYNGKRFDCLDKVTEIAQQIESIGTVVLIPFLPDHPSALPKKTRAVQVSWLDACAHLQAPLNFEQVPFNHPLYIMYSSGTTGVPKCIVHGAGGTLLQHTKELILHSDLRREDTIVYFTTCGWMMWNWLASSLFVGATVVLYDGSPSHPTIDRLWRLAADERVTHFGTSAKFIGACRHSIPDVISKRHDLSKLRVILSTGSPLLPEDFDWVYGHVKQDVQLSSISGGTDILSCFMLGNPTLPVNRGEIQCLGLGMDVVAMGDNGPVLGEKAELACRSPFPSHPIGFWSDDDGSKLTKAYYHRDPHVWFHGDYIQCNANGGVVVYGRSDATLNPGGVRIGTAEIYRLVETLDEIEDSVVVGLPHEGDVRVVLFVKLAARAVWSAELQKKIELTIRQGATPRHVPAVIRPVAAIPYTLSGKKVELAVLDVLSGREPKNVAALANPEALEHYRGIGL